MAKIKSNKLVSLGIAFLVTLLAAFFYFNKLGTNTNNGTAAGNKVSQSTQSSSDANQRGTLSGADDTARESLTNVTSQLTRVQQELQEAQEKLRQQQLDSESNINSVKSDLKSEMENIVSSLSDKLSVLTESLNKPVSEYEVNEPEKPHKGQLRGDGRIWFSGSQGGTEPEQIHQTQTLVQRLAGRFGNAGELLDGVTSVAGSSESTKAAVLPVYTIPSNSTLMGSTAITAIIGRVPIDGTIRDPIPFKIITGSQNLTANNLYLPEIQEAIWSGVAQGDGALKCATGKITSVTFVFYDGTILTQNADNPDEGFGWISNGAGYPCIPGTYVSNAPEVMKKLFVAGFASGSANAFAQAQIDSVTSASGSLSQTITGKTGEFAFAQGLSSGFQHWATYISERARDQFDAVVVQPGIDVAINTTEPILIDFNTTGRKLRHTAHLQVSNDRQTNNGGID